MIETSPRHRLIDRMPGNTSATKLPRSHAASRGPARAGFVLPAVVFGLVVMSVLTVAALRTSSDTSRSTRAFLDSGLALYAAEAGLRQTIASWPGGVASMNPGDSLVAASSTQLANGTTYRAVIYRTDSLQGQVYLVVVQGRSAGSTPSERIIEAVIASATTSVFNQALLSGGDLKIGGSGGIADSYNSSNGAYNAATADSGATLRANGNVTVNSADTVKGNIIQAGTSPSVSGVTITGGITTGSAAITMPPIVTCPTTGYTPASSLPSPLPSHVTYSSGDLIVSGPLTLTGGPYFFHSLKVSDSLNITASSHVDIYVEDYLTVSSGGLVNNNSRLPGRLSLWACNTAAKPGGFSLTGGGSGYFSIYAPDRDVVVGGGGDFFGAAIGSTISFTGGSRFHYDRALGAGAGSALTLITGSWAELTLY